MPDIHLHRPVMVTEVIEGLHIQPSGIYIDCTFGRGGHSLAVLKQLGESGKLIGIDKDVDAIKAAQKIKDPRFSLFHGSFTDMKAIAEKLHIVGKVDGILLDLGVSSPQLDNEKRGFSFLRAGPLDMRMDTSKGEPLAVHLAKIKEQDLIKILKTYGEEKFAKKIARAIVAARKITPITTTNQLAGIVAKAHPAWKKDKHPATQTFQALRIFVNNELEELKTVLPQCLEVLKVGGRLLVISFHSLEDRITKKFIQEEEHGSQERQWQKLPLRQIELKLKLRRVGRAIRPNAVEVNHNPRARSAVLRIVEKIK